VKTSTAELIREDMTQEEKNEIFIKKFKVEVDVMAAQVVKDIWHKNHNEEVTVGFTLNNREW